MTAGTLRRTLRITVVRGKTSVGAIYQRPRGARACLVFAHGAGAGMRHPFMEKFSSRLVDAGTGTLRFQFPYMEAGRRRPDRPAVLMATIRAAVRRAHRLAPHLPVIAGGKSMGGRMTSMAQAEEPLEGVRGIVFVGFPLHAPGRNGLARAAHLSGVDLPMLFVQGTRDRLANLTLMRRVARAPGRRAQLHEVAGADHGFHVLKRSGRSDDQVLAEVAGAVAGWIGGWVSR